MIALPSYIDPEMWAAFVESRKAMKVPFTPLAQKLVVRKLMAMHSDGWDPNASLEKSAIYGYRGVFEVQKYQQEKSERDPVLVQIEQDRKKAQPIPDAIKEKFKQLRVKM